MGDNTKIKGIAASALASFDSTMQVLGLAGGKRSGREYLPLNPKRSDQRRGSFTINRDSGAWMDGATGDSGGDLVSLAAYIWDFKQGEAAKQLAKELGLTALTGKEGDIRSPGNSGKGSAAPKQKESNSGDPSGPVCVMPVPSDAPKPPNAHSRHGKPTQRWAYLDKSGAVNFYHDRYEPKEAGARKQFAPLTLWRRANGRLEWQFKAPPVPRPLLGLNHLATRPDVPVCLVEGEKAADAGALLWPEVVLMTWQGGAMAVVKADLSPLSGRDVILWSDNDDPGRKAMETVAHLLEAAGAKRVRMVNVGLITSTPSGGTLKVGDDAADLLANGWTAETFAKIAESDGFLIDPPSPRLENDQNGTVTQPVARRFEVNAKGVHLLDVDRNGNQLSPRWICAPLDVLAMVRSQDNSGWGLLVAFLDYDRKEHREIIPARDFRGEGMEIADRLLDRGLAMAPSCRRSIVEYLQTARVKGRARITARIGWHGEVGSAVFVLPDRAFGMDSEKWIYTDEGLTTNTFRQKGDLNGWRENVARLCRGNSRLLFAVSVAFASPLIYLSGAESGGFHFRSNSSDGKTTALRIAASVCGGSDYMQRWRATDNGLEALAMQRCDAPLLLDELAQLDPKAAGEVAYMLANGSGKSRANRTGGMRDQSIWRLLFLSAGEIGLAQHMGDAGKNPRAGQELRLAEIPADAGTGLGVFEDLHHYLQGGEFAKALDRAARQHYGVAWVAFMEKLVSSQDSLADTLHAAQKAFELRFLSEDAHGQARRVAARFAMVGAAGEIATDWGITGWQPGEALKAAGVCFLAWLKGRGGEGNQEELAALAHVREFLRRYTESAFTDWDRPAVSDNHAGVRSDRAGFRRFDANGGDNTVEFFIFNDVWRTRVCKGFDPVAVGRLLVAKGYVRSGDKERPWLSKITLPGEGKSRVVHVLPTIWDDE